MVALVQFKDGDPKISQLCRQDYFRKNQLLYGCNDWISGTQAVL